MAENHEKLYDILIDVQKQLGKVSRETGEQTQKLISIDNKQTELTAYQKTANSKISIAMTEIETLKLRLVDYEEIKEGAKDVVTTKKAILMFSGTLILLAGIFWGIIKYASTAYLDNHITAFLKDNNILIQSDTGWQD